MKKKVIALLALIVVLIVACVMVLVSLLNKGEEAEPVQQEQSEQVNADIYNDESILQDEMEAVMGSDVETEHSELPEFTDSVLSQMDAAVAKYLSVGNYAELDSYLADLDSRYSSQNEEDDQLGEDQTELIAMYRNDIALIQNINETNGEIMFQSFSTPDACASAVIHSDISEKLYAFVNLDSKVYNAPLTEEAEQVNLATADMTVDETMTLLTDINNRSEDNEYLNLMGYDCTLHDVEYRILVLQSSFGKWRPYSITSLNGEDDTVPTVLELQKMAGQNPDLDLDSIDFEIVADGEAGAPGLADRNEVPMGTPDANVPSGMQNPSQGSSQPSDDTQTAPDSTPEPTYTDEDYAALDALQKVLDGYDVNTTSLPVIQKAIDDVRAIGNRDGLSADLVTIINEKVTQMQQSYDELAALLAE